MAKPLRKYYVLNEQLELEENYTTEFKGHTNICAEEIPPWCVLPGKDRMSRAPISKAICGFLNTGDGGTLYVGVSDEGVVIGRIMTRYTMDHFVASLEDTLERYTPPVEPHRYKVRFVPVLKHAATDNAVQRFLKDSQCAENDIDSEKRLMEHTLRTVQDCWCEIDNKARIHNGYECYRYVIEIKVNKWDPNDDRNKYAAGKMKAHPIHQDEDGRARCRRNACVDHLSLQDVSMYAAQQVEDHYRPILDKLNAELVAMESSGESTKP